MTTDQRRRERIRDLEQQLAAQGEQIAAAIEASLDRIADFSTSSRRAGMREAARIARNFTPADDATVDEAAVEVISGEECRTYLVGDRPLLNGTGTPALYRPECLIHGELTGGFFTRSTADKIATEHRAPATVPVSPSDAGGGGSWVCGRCGTAPESHASASSTCIYDPVFKPSDAGGADEGGLRAAIEARAANWQKHHDECRPNAPTLIYGDAAYLLRLDLAAHPAVDRG